MCDRMRLHQKIFKHLHPVILRRRGVLHDLLEEMKKQSPTGWILMSPNSIGEVLFACAFARSFISTHGGPVTLCVQPHHASIPEQLYPGRFVRVVPLNMNVMRAFSETGFVPPNYFGRDYPINLSPPHYGDGRMMEFLNLMFKRHGYGGLSVADAFRHMLHLDWNAPMEKPFAARLRENKSLLRQLNLEPTSYVLLFSGNSTNIPAPKEFWIALAGRYLAQGVKVVVNTKGAVIAERIEFPNGVIHAQLDVIDALALAQHARFVVIGNNGLLALMAFAATKCQESPHVHCLLTDKMCVHYDKLSVAYEEAFVPIEGLPAMHYGGRELISDPGRYTEWKVFTTEPPKTQEEIAQHIVSMRLDSPHIVPPMAVPDGIEPKAVEFDEAYRPGSASE